MNDREEEHALQKDEGIALLFGDLFSSDLDASAWDNESVPDDSENESSKVVVSKVTQRSRKVDKPLPVRGFELPYEEGVFSYAYKCSGYCTIDGRVEKPPVKIVDFSKLGRGFGLIASRRIARGEVIYTERAAVASQVPTGRGDDSCFATRGCQNCFRSLEPISSCPTTSSSAKEQALPSPEMWPVLEYDFQNHKSDLDSKLRQDKFGRIQCLSCQSWFCCKGCQTSFHREFPSCCAITRAVEQLPKLLLEPGQEEEDKDVTTEVQPSIVLAVRMYAASLQRYRSNRKSWEKGMFSDGLCGEASDVTPLELGMPIRNDSDGTVQYTLCKVYDCLLEAFAVSASEREAFFSLNYFNRLAAKAARNGFGILTQSPFKSYYDALLRSAGGRGSDRHEALKEQVARALGSATGRLERGMDREVEARVAVEIAAIFPLTARINHSCAPNAEVRSQEFVDYHMDLVAVRDIEEGEEITISYLFTRAGQQNRRRRQRELLAKYLFSCDCKRCQEEGSVPA